MKTFFSLYKQVSVGYPLSSRVFDQSCEDKWKGATVKNLCQENYQATANAALWFPHFCRELVKAAAQPVKKEVPDYCKKKSMARYEGDPLKLKNFNAEEFLEEASERMAITHSIITMTSKDGVKFLVNKQVLALSVNLNTWLPR